MDKLKRSCRRLSNRHSVGDVERLRLSTSPTFAAVVVEPTTNRAHSSSPDETLLYNYALPSLRPDADYEAQSKPVVLKCTNHVLHQAFRVSKSVCRLAGSLLVRIRAGSVSVFGVCIGIRYFCRYFFMSVQYIRYRYF